MRAWTEHIWINGNQTIHSWIARSKRFGNELMVLCTGFKVKRDFCIIPIID